jgi:hypothetical protein
VDARAGRKLKTIRELADAFQDGKRPSVARTQLALRTPVQ